MSNSSSNIIGVQEFLITRRAERWATAWAMIMMDWKEDTIGYQNGIIQ
jgi:hypothetical protein